MRTSWLVPLVVVALGVGGCSSDPSVVTDPVPSDTADTAVDPSTSPEPSAAPSGAPAQLPGEPFDIVAPAGTPLVVVGVAHDDVLNVRVGPGVEFDVVADIEPTGEITSLGLGRLLDGSIWQAVRAGDVEGWVNLSFVGQAGSVDDLTQRAIERLGGRPTAEDVEVLGRIVAEAFASEDPPSRITMVVGPTSGDVDEVTFDVIGLGDDSVLGLRLHVFAVADVRGGVELGSVEATTLCGRGVAEGGLCA